MANNDIIDLTSDGEDDNQVVLPNSKSISSRPLDAALVNAITSVQSQRLLNTLIQVCTQIPAAADLAQSLLVVREPGFRSTNNNTTTISTSTDSAKRQRTRWATCDRCENEFDISDHTDKKACEYHPGKLELDWESDTWADWDEDCHGPMDRQSNRDEYPEGFKWSCCGSDGRGMHYDNDDNELEGCKLGVHVERQPRAKKRRYQ